MVVKFCPGCETDKPVTDFSRNKRRHDGLTNYCKVCWRDISRNQYLKNRAKLAARYREKRAESGPPARGNGITTVCGKCGLRFKRAPGSTMSECLSCRRGTPSPHGSCSTYQRGCRCRPCTDAASERAVTNRRRRLQESGLPDDNCHRTRARKGGGSYEPVRPQEVFARDGWICGICSESVDPSVKWPDRRSASLDHIVPLAKGGDHSYANVQCSHLSCNQIKSARVAYEPSMR